MKKILMTLFTVFVVFAAGAIVSAGTTEEEPDFKLPDLYESGDYEYKKANDHKTVIITAYNGKEESIEIPSELDGYPVSGIGYQAFTYLKMNDLSIPESVRTIGSRAFEYCTIRDSLVLPEQVTIEQDAFSYAVLPSVLTIPAGAVAAEDSFSYCEHVNRLMISPDAVIKDGAFGYCDDLVKVVCAEGSRLEKEGFEYCRSLEEVLLCGEVELEEKAFYHCDRAVVTKTDAAAFDNQDDNQDDNQGDDAPVSVTRVAGGWGVTEDAAVPEDAQAVFDAAMSGDDSVQYEAVALLATQVVRGMNYCFLARSHAASPDAIPSYHLVYIWHDIDGTAQVMDVQDIEFGL